MEIKYWAGTDVGRKRSSNEDNFLIDKRLKLFVVADGMGGHASGEIASAVAVHGVREIIDRERDILDSYDDNDPKCHVEVCTLLEYAVHHTCESIFQKARREPEKRGMGTTLVALLIIGARGFIAYVGDSRIYLLRGGIVYQLTEDHSLKNELIRMGKITADEFDSSPYANLKNAMTRAVGVYDSVEADTLDFDIIPGDTFLLCSDGLYEYLSDDDIVHTITLPQIREIPGMLIDTANSRGGKDNITAVVVQVAGDADDRDRAAELNFTLDTLKNVPLFRELNYQQLVRVMNLAKQSPMQVGQQLFREGDPGHDLLVVLRGRIELTQNEVSVAELSAGAHLGEMSLIDASARSATATVLAPGKILSITRDDFYDVLRREPALAVKLLWSFVRVLSDRLRTTTSDLATARSDSTSDITSSAAGPSAFVGNPSQPNPAQMFELARQAVLDKRETIETPVVRDNVELGRRVTLVSTTINPMVRDPMASPAPPTTSPSPPAEDAPTPATAQPISRHLTPAMTPQLERPTTSHQTTDAPQDLRAPRAADPAPRSAVPRTHPATGSAPGSTPTPRPHHISASAPAPRTHQTTSPTRRGARPARTSPLDGPDWIAPPFVDSASSDSLPRPASPRPKITPAPHPRTRSHPSRIAAAPPQSQATPNNRSPSTSSPTPDASRAPRTDTASEVDAPRATTTPRPRSTDAPVKRVAATPTTHRKPDSSASPTPVNDTGSIPPPPVIPPPPSTSRPLPPPSAPASDESTVEPSDPFAEPDPSA